MRDMQLTEGTKYCLMHLIEKKIADFGEMNLKIFVKMSKVELLSFHAAKGI